MMRSFACPQHWKSIMSKYCVTAHCRAPVRASPPGSVFRFGRRDQRATSAMRLIFGTVGFRLGVLTSHALLSHLREPLPRASHLQQPAAFASLRRVDCERAAALGVRTESFSILH